MEHNIEQTLQVEVIDRVNAEAELKDAFKQIQMPRTPVQLAKFVVASHDTAEMQYVQCVMEMRGIYNAVRELLLDRELLLLDIQDIENLPDLTPRDEIERSKKLISLENMDLRLLGKLREFGILYDIWQAYPKYTREEIDLAQVGYWIARLKRQALGDVQQTGRVGAGNLEALRQLGTPIPGEPAFIAEQIDDVREELANVSHKLLQS